MILNGLWLGSETKLKSFSNLCFFLTVEIHNETWIIDDELGGDTGYYGALLFNQNFSQKSTQLNFLLISVWYFYNSPM